MQWIPRRPSGRYFLACLFLLLSPALSAVQPSTDGTGQVLLYPLVSQGGRFDTLVTLSNHGEQVPTVARVNLRHGQTGDEIASLNVYLGAGETFAAAFTGGRLEVASDTCFSSQPAPSGDAGTVDLGTVDAAFLEVIEMGTLQADGGIGSTLDLEETTCQETREMYSAAFDSGDMLAPRGNLAGASYLIDVPQGLSFPVPTVALADFRDSPLFTEAGRRHPNLNDAEPAESVLFGDFRPAGVEGPVLRSTWRHPVDAVSAVLSAAVADTDFSVEPGLSAATDVILTFPTRHYYVGVQNDRERDPFVTHYARTDVVDPIEEPGQQFLVIARDRDGDARVPVFGRDQRLFLSSFGKRAKCSPVRPNAYPGPLLTGSQIDIYVGQARLLPVQAAHQARQVTTPDDCSVLHAKPVREMMDAGRLWFDFAAYEMESLEGQVHYGLPVIGASLTAFANETTTLANYGLVHPLRVEQDASYPSASSVPAAELLATDPARAPITAAPPTISADGSVVAWSTEVPLANDDGDDDNDVYVVEDGSAPRLVTPDLSQYREDHYLPALSGNGDWLAYNTCQAVPDGPESSTCEPETRLVSLADGSVTRIEPPDGARIEAFHRPMISATGSRVAFIVEESNQLHVELFDRVSGQKKRVASDIRRLFDMGPGGDRLFLSRDGQEIEDRDRLFLVDPDSGQETELNPGFPVVPPELGAGMARDGAMSADGRNIVVSYGSGLSGVFWHDRQTGDLRRLDITHDGIRTNAVSANGVAISDDGRTVYFTEPDRLLPGIPRNTTQLYRWTPDGGLQLASVTPGATAGNGYSVAPAVNAGGLVYAYITSAPDIAPAGNGGKNHVAEYRVIRAVWPGD